MAGILLTILSAMALLVRPAIMVGIPLTIVLVIQTVRPVIMVEIPLTIVLVIQAVHPAIMVGILLTIVLVIQTVHPAIMAGIQPTIQFGISNRLLTVERGPGDRSLFLFYLHK